MATNKLIVKSLFINYSSIVLLSNSFLRSCLKTRQKLGDNAERNSIITGLLSSCGGRVLRTGYPRSLRNT